MGVIAAFFDMDHTIIWENSGLTSVKYARKQGLIPAGHLALGIFKIIPVSYTHLTLPTIYSV